MAPQVRTSVLLRFPPALLARVDVARGHLNRHAFLIDLIERAVSRPRVDPDVETAGPDPVHGSLPASNPAEGPEDAGSNFSDPNPVFDAAAGALLSRAEYEALGFGFTEDQAELLDRLVAAQDSPQEMPGPLPTRDELVVGIARLAADKRMDDSAAPISASDPPATAGTREEREGPSGPDGDVLDAPVLAAGASVEPLNLSQDSRSEQANERAPVAVADEMLAESTFSAGGGGGDDGGSAALPTSYLEVFGGAVAHEHVWQVGDPRCVLCGDLYRMGDDA
jgi:hypothetical protein